MKTALTIVPDYFFTVPASSSGTHHPQYALEEGGLARHTKAAVGIAQEWFRLEMFGFDGEEQDCITAALILHDTYKFGLNYEQRTVTERPLVAVGQFSQHAKLTNRLTQKQYAMIFDCIGHHMRQWVADFKTRRRVLHTPRTKMAKFTHLCDYIASRKCFEYTGIARQGVIVMDRVIVSDHAEQRIRKRMGVKRKAVQKIAERAYTEGLDYSDANGSLKDYLGYLYATRSEKERYKVWNQMLFIYSGRVLITVTPVPKAHHKRAMILQAAVGAEG